MIVQGDYVNMGNSNPIAIIGGYDLIARSFFSKAKLINKESIFINVGNKNIQRKGIYNYKIFQLKRILDKLNQSNIKNLLFIGKIFRPNLSTFKKDGEIERYIPLLMNSYRHGDGRVLVDILDIFSQKGFNVLSPYEVSKSFFFTKHELNDVLTYDDKNDAKKSFKLLNHLSKYDNAQSAVIINGYIIAIEAAEGTDKLLSRVISIRKSLNQLKNKAGIFTKIPKRGQSKLIDLPVIGVKTLKLVNKANLNGIAIDPKFTIVQNKSSFLKYAQSNNLKIYNIRNSTT